MAKSGLDIEARRRVVAWILGAALLILAGRLFQLQVVQHEVYFRQSEKNRVRVITLEPPRGQIYDRNHRPLVENLPCYTLSVLPHHYRGREDLLVSLASFVGANPEEMARSVRQGQRAEFLPVKVRRDMPFELLARVQERWLDFPGLVIETEPKRTYTGMSRLSHVLGYLGEVAESELKALKDQDYRTGDIIGKTGLERQYEKVLRGRRGYQYVEVDALGREIRTLPMEKWIPPSPGLDLVLAIDDRLQAKLESLLEGKRAAGVFLDPRNGEVLALASSPSYDLQWFAGVLNPAVWDSLVSHPDKPLLNRVTQGLYPPGSTYKLITALAGVNDGVFSPESRVSCGGGLSYGGRFFACWYGQGHGSQDLYGAIAHSCNVYFYTMGMRVGLERWARYSRLLRFGQPTGIDLPAERAGLVPDAHYMDTRYGKGNWVGGTMLNLAIGQGDLLTTPLQMAQLAMVIANRGKGFVPHVVKALENPLTGKQMPVRVDSFVVREIRPEVFEVVREGMREVVNGAGGTGRGCALGDVIVAGKTGTAQNPHGDPHGWFIGFAPYDAPEVAFCVFVENGGSGSGAAVPIVREVLRLYFDEVRVSAPAQMAAAPSRSLSSLAR
ncbi:MAG: penicillin-binding protein 2 [candidate division KSB1 bacterium]|nr:penicillin-binding protein 2 [candidate division KSB1 bacterium]